MKKFISTLFLALLTAASWAYDAYVDGIYYFLDSSKKVAVVTYLYCNSANNKEAYSGNIVIPASVTHDGVTYSVTSIGDYAFSCCSDLTSIEMPNSVTSIGWYAFYGCSGLTSVNIPNSVTTIENWAFYGCSGLTSTQITDLTAWCKIDFKTSYSNPLAYSRTLLLNGEEVKDLVIPNSVTSIGKYSFYYCSCLTSLTIPESISSIGMAAFFDCYSLTDIYVEATTPPTSGGYVFNTESDDETIYNTTILHVPDGTKDTYSSAYGWMDFKNIVDNQSSGIEEVSGSKFQVPGTRKVFQNGRIVIERNDKQFTADGAEIK